MILYHFLDRIIIIEEHDLIDVVFLEVKVEPGAHVKLLNLGLDKLIGKSLIQLLSQVLINLRPLPLPLIQIKIINLIPLLLLFLITFFKPNMFLLLFLPKPLDILRFLTSIN